MQTTAANIPSLIAPEIRDHFKIELDIPTHTYRVNGEIKPSPTKILKEMGISRDYAAIDPAVLQHAAERGTYVHEAILLYERGVLDLDTLDDEVKPYFEGYLSFRGKHKWEPSVPDCEVPLYHPDLDYCVTLDGVGKLDGIPGIIDWKTSSSFDRAVEIQTAAQALAWNYAAVDFQVDRRYSLSLSKKGTFKLRDHSGVDVKIWKDCLGVYRWLSQ